MKKRSTIQANKFTRFGALLMALAMVFTLSFTRLVNAEELPIEETLAEQIEETPAAAAPTAVAAPATPAAPAAPAAPAPSATAETPAAPQAYAEVTQQPEETQAPAEETQQPEETQEPEETQGPAEETQQPEETQEPEETQGPAEETQQPEETQAPVAETQEPEETQAPAEESAASEEPIVTDDASALPDDAVLLQKIIDALDPNRSISIYVSWGGQLATFGSTAKLIAVLEGYDEVVYTIQWQRSIDNLNWEGVPGAKGSTYSLVVTKDNYLDYWRVAVSISDVKGE